jgi:regulator of cell morphogenesis and NO signaling
MEGMQTAPATESRSDGVIAERGSADRAPVDRTPVDLTWADRTLGEIAVAVPAAIAVFRRVGLDFCCGGDATLRDAAAARHLPLPTLEAELADLAAQATEAPPEQRTAPALIDHILRRFHDVHRQEIPMLADLARKVEAVHRTHALVPKGLAAALTELGDELEMHMAKEEQVLFPAMRRGLAGPIAQPIARMRYEHDEHGMRLRLLAEITHDLALPEDACRSWRALYAGVEKLVGDLMQHIHLENNVLFPQFVPAASR